MGVELMCNTFKHRNFMVVDLAQGILARTLIPRMAHSALRSGFAGYPTNPRWSAAKLRAWKMGRQWRDGLERGELVVRSSDSMLVPAADSEEDSDGSSGAQPLPLKPICQEPMLAFG